jgi:hypothetical protein
MRRHWAARGGRLNDCQEQCRYSVTEKAKGKKARGSAPGPRWVRRPQTPFCLSRDWLRRGARFVEAVVVGERFMRFPHVSDVCEESSADSFARCRCRPPEQIKLGLGPSCAARCRVTAPAGSWGQGPWPSSPTVRNSQKNPSPRNNGPAQAVIPLARRAESSRGFTIVTTQHGLSYLAFSFSYEW